MSCSGRVWPLSSCSGSAKCSRRDCTIPTESCEGFSCFVPAVVGSWWFKALCMTSTENAGQRHEIDDHLRDDQDDQGRQVQSRDGGNVPPYRPDRKSGVEGRG